MRREQTGTAEVAPALPPDLAEVYRDKVEALVDGIVVGWDEEVGGHTIEIVGEPAVVWRLGTNENAAAVKLRRFR